jgi:hypothetical protein
MAGVIPIQSHMNVLAPVSTPNGRLLQKLTLYDVVMSNGEEIEAYVSTNADLIPLLEGICAKLREAFGKRAELSLEWYRDPEQADQYLCLFLRQEKYEAGILKRIETVIAPFMPTLETASANLLVTTDFRPPQG